MGGLGTEFAIFIGIRFVGKEGGTPLDEEGGIPRRDAIINARSWYSFCRDRSKCSLTLITTLSISLKKPNLVSNLCNCKSIKYLMKFKEAEHTRTLVMITFPWP